jgi:hypothetical protein
VYERSSGKRSARSPAQGQVGALGVAMGRA